MIEPTKTQTENPMGHAPMLPLIIKMALPSMFSMLVQSMYNIVDSIFVSMISQQALAAVSLVFPVQNLIIGVGVGTGIGLNSLVSRRLGEKNQKAADLAATHGVILGLCNWVVFALLAFFLVKPFFGNYSNDPVLNEYAIQYAEVVLYCSFGVFISLNLEKILQATGNMMDPMKIMLIGTITNIILDPIMIFGWLGCPAMGVRGAAIATVIGQIAGMAYALFISVGSRHNHAVAITVKGFRFHKKTMLDIYRVGLPSMVMQCIGSVMVAGMNTILIRFSQAAVNAFGVYFKLQSFIFMPVFGLTSGVMPIMGYCYGARKRARLMSCLKYATGIAIIIMVLGTGVFLAIPAPLLSIFNADSDLITIGTVALRVIAISFIPAAIDILLSTMFQAVGMGINSLIMSVLRQLVVILPVAFWLSQFGVNYVWWALPVSEMISLVVAILLFWRVYKTRLLPLDAEIAAS